MKELYAADGDHIARRVRQIMAEAGPRRLVITTTGTPLEPIPPHVEQNYHRMIDTVLGG